MSDDQQWMWRKSTLSESGNCVEVTRTSEGIAVRDSKDPNGALLTFTLSEWSAFLGGVRGGEFEAARLGERP